MQFPKEDIPLDCFMLSYPSASSQFFPFHLTQKAVLLQNPLVASEAGGAVNATRSQREERASPLMEPSLGANCSSRSNSHLALARLPLQSEAKTPRRHAEKGVLARGVQVKAE